MTTCWKILSVCLSFNFLSNGDAANGQNSDRKPLYFQLHVSQSDVLDISGYIPAVDVALRLINSNETILPEYHLMYTEIIDPQCKDTPGVQGLIDHVTNASRTMTEIIIIGADCSISSQPIASLAPLWNLVQISPVSSSPRLSDSAVYSTFLRVVAPDNSIAIGIVQLMKFLEWKYISIITQEEDIFTLTRDALMERVQNSSLTTLSSVSFPSDESPQNALRNLKASSGRIIFLNCYSQYALEILCQALSLGMTYPDYAWITFGWYFDRFWSHPYPDRNYAAFNTCKPAELENIVNHMIFIDQYSRQDDQDSETIIGGLNRTTYEQEYREQWNKTFGNESHPDHLEDSKFIYDATWLGALALHKTDQELKEMNPSRGLENFTYGSADIRKLIFKHALATSFNGATGSVKLLPNGDRGPELRFYQYRRQGGALNRSYVGFMDDSQMLTIFTHSQPLYRDGTPKSHIHETIHVALFAAYTVLSVAGAVFAIACLIFNVIFRNKMIVKLSSPYLNIIFIIGILMIYLLVIFLGIDDNLVDIQVMSGFCQATVWIGVIAFTLVYGVVLAKTFKVFYIFKNLQVSKPDQKRTIQDWHMFIFIGCLLAIDILFLIIVTAVPRAILTVMLNEKPLLAGDLPSEANLCTSATSHIWGPILLVYKAVELVFSLIFVFETRKIKIKELNDSRMVIFSVYTIVVAGIAVAPVIALLSDRVTVKYAIIGIICLASATLLLGINFIPKMYFLYRKPSGEIDLNLTHVTDKIMKDKPASGSLKLRTKSRTEKQSSVDSPSVIHTPSEDVNGMKGKTVKNETCLSIEETIML